MPLYIVCCASTALSSVEQSSLLKQSLLTSETIKTVSKRRCSLQFHSVVPVLSLYHCYYYVCHVLSILILVLFKNVMSLLCHQYLIDHQSVELLIIVSPVSALIMYITHLIL